MEPGYLISLLLQYPDFKMRHQHSSPSKDRQGDMLPNCLYNRRASVPHISCSPINGTVTCPFLLASRGLLRKVQGSPPQSNSTVRHWYTTTEKANSAPNHLGCVLYFASEKNIYLYWHDSFTSWSFLLVVIRFPIPQSDIRFLVKERLQH